MWSSCVILTRSSAARSQFCGVPLRGRREICVSANLLAAAIVHSSPPFAFRMPHSMKAAT